MAKKAAKKKVARKTRKRIDWTEAKEFFLNMNVESDKRVCTFKTVAEHFGVAPGTVRNRAAKAKWEEHLVNARETKRKQQIQAAEQAHNQSLSELQKIAINSETEVRHRQASAARLMMSKGVAKLKTVSPKDLTPREATMLIRYGLQEERRALGIPDEIRVTGEMGESREITPHDIHAIVDDLIELVEGPDGTYQKAN